MTTMIDKLTKKESYLDTLDNSIDLTTAQLIHQISDDRQRAEETYLELLSLFNQGKTSPDDVRELNKAQEILQATTDQMQKLLATLTKLKTGSDKIQIAQISNVEKPGFDKESLIDMLEAAARELPNEQDKVIEVVPSEVTRPAE